ncbi:MAG: histidine kinase [Bacteroidales bacterium]|nr:histidine kinase [Bacteroidales bacterium]
MNKNTTPEYLSLKRIALVALIISLGFHAIMMLSFFFGNTLFSSELVKAMNPQHFHIGRFLFFTTASFIIVFLILLYNRKVLSYSYKNKYNELIVIILGSLIITAVFSIGFVYTRAALSPQHPDPEFMYKIMRDSLVRDLTMAAVVLLVVQLLRSQYYQKTIAVENEALRSENILTRFEALKSQLDPHFLFNSLNTLQSLITLDTEKAENYLQQLSSVLRYTLQNKEVLSLEEELKCVHAYCEMMQIRYGENLKFEFQIDEKYNDYYVLPLSLQSLIENSVKHNVISSKQPLTVTLATADDCVSVSNPIQAKTQPEESNGIGLVNLTERYRLKWNKEVEITNDGSTFCVKLPLIKNN